MATYFIHTTKTVGETGLFCKYQRDGARICFPTGIKVDIEHWNKAKVSEDYLRAYKCTEEGAKVFRLLRKIDTLLDDRYGKGCGLTSDDVPDIRKNVKDILMKESEKKTDSSKTKVLYPIKKEYVRKIFDGSKAYEFRRSFCNPSVDSIVIYESAGRGMVVGECKIVGRICCDPEKLWSLTKEYAGIPEKDFFEYFKDCDKACAYVIGDVNIFLRPKKLSDYGIEYPPQNYLYVRD